MKIKKSSLVSLLLVMAITGSLLVLGACSKKTTTTTTPATTTATTTAATTQTTTTTTAATSTTSAAPVIVNLTAQNIAFDKSSITVPAGASVTIVFNNKDSGIPHNFAVYNNSNASQVIFQGQVVTGPGTMNYNFTAPSTPGTYFFRCDIHPTQMTGSFIVQ